MVPKPAGQDKEPHLWGLGWGCAAKQTKFGCQKAKNHKIDVMDSQITEISLPNTKSNTKQPRFAHCDGTSCLAVGNVRLGFRENQHMKEMKEIESINTLLQTRSLNQVGRARKSWGEIQCQNWFLLGLDLNTHGSTRLNDSTVTSMSPQCHLWPLLSV